MKQTILTIALLTLILATGFVWYRYLRSPASETASASAEPAIDPQRLEEYRELRQIRLDTSVFSDPLFQLLAEPTPPVSATAAGVPAGRSNPFAPLP